MRYSQLTAIAACVTASSAFLLPPSISESDIDIIKTLPFEDAIGIDNRVVEISCPGCPVVTDIQGKMHTAQVESMLQLNFSLAHESGFDKLMLNGMQIYPLDLRSTTFMEPLTASQMVKADDDTWEYASSPTIGYSMSIHHPVVSSKNDKLDLVSIHIEILEVAGKFLSGLPTVDLKLLETPSHALMIGDAVINKPKSEVSKPTNDAQECTTIVCKWRAIIADRVSKLKGGLKGGCHKGKPAVVEVAAGPKAHDKEHHSGHGHSNGHGSERPHKPYRYHHRHGGVRRFFRGLVLHIFVPVLIGVMFGITASLIGMVVGHIAIFLWRITFRRGQLGQCSSRCSRYSKVESTETLDDEAKGLMENQGPPPEYEVAVKDEKTEEV